MSELGTLTKKTGTVGEAQLGGGGLADWAKVLLAPLNVWSRLRNKTQTTWYITSQIVRNIVLEERNKANKSAKQMQFRINQDQEHYKFIKKEQNTNLE